MKTRDIAKRLTAFSEGRPLPAGATRKLEIAEVEDRMILTFLRMGGESLPWGVAYRVGGAEPILLSVPDARRRDPVADMCVELSEVLCGFLGSALLTGEEVDPKNPPPLPLRQIWVPNSAHIEMLHLLAVRYSYTEWGEPMRARSLRALGRVCGFLFSESQRPGQRTVLDASAVLREHFVFPADDIRQQHLGFVLALLQTSGGLAARFEAGEAAERLSVSTSLDPALEREKLEGSVDAYDAARREGDEPAEQLAAEEIAHVLAEENLRRINLVEEAIDLLEHDPRPINAGATELSELSIEEREYRYRRRENYGSLEGDVEKRFTTSPTTDNYKPSATTRYYRVLASDDLAGSALFHSDPELQEVSVVEGDAVRGVLAAIETEVSKVNGKKVEVWTVESDSTMSSRVRDGSKLCVAGLPGKDCIVTEIVVDDHRAVRSLRVEPHKELRGSIAQDEEVLLLPATAADITDQKYWLSKESGGAASWLIDGSGRRPRRRKLRGDDVLERVEELRSR